jgi:hypothetical protein
MIKRGLSRFTRRLLHRGQTGQTIVILAFGFIVLLGFVGIVTDVSLMFVRYSTLRRAIDAAAVSAAGQMRRAVPNDDEKNRAIALGGTQAVIDQRALGYAYARNVANVNLAARQFIELYGLSPTTVLVDTCATTRLPDGTFTDPQLECETGQQPRKLVRVTAQVDSPTVFLRLLGWGTVTLEATAMSETAVLDVVMIFDVSESMLNQTSYDDWKNVPGVQPNGADQSMRYYPPRLAYAATGNLAGAWNYTNQYFASLDSGNYDFNGGWTWVLNRTHEQLYNHVEPTTNPPNQRIFLPEAFYVDGIGTDNSPITQANYLTDTRQPREECRVRFFPSAGGLPSMPNGTGEYLPNNDVRQELTAYMTTFKGISTAFTYPPGFDGFVPAYNYFGCCNDPNLSWEFEDLICQPMRKVRDASEDFLDRIDFSRGDRVGFVTFDRTAYLVDPDGSGPTGGPLTPMMESQAKAVEMLQKVVGVRADPTYYADTDNDGFWNSYVTGGSTWTPTADPTKAQLVEYTGTNPSYNQTPLGGLNDYPVKDNCIFQNASLPYPSSLYSSPKWDAASQAVPPPVPPAVDPFPSRPLYNAARYPNPLSSVFNSAGVQTTVMHPNLNDPTWQSQMQNPNRSGGSWLNDEERNGVKALYSYELRAGCRGSNVGAALRVANNALLDPATVRTNNAVWVMVMLGDGAAAGSDPVRRNAADLQIPTVYNAYAQPPVPGDYGVYGVCPYAGTNFDGPLVDQGWGRSFPYCMDTKPEDRHFCFDPRIKDAAGNLYIDLATSAECENEYDVDDFARDWADFIGLEDPFPALVTADQLGRGDLQLPTIFTIGFGLDFQNGTGSCTDNIPDCLGEELLRYVADVGDNNRIDTDYQQDLRADQTLDKGLSFNEDWGSRGPCEGPVVGYGDPSEVPPAQLTAALVNPLAAGESCGNYFNAPNAEELQNVFDTIASRMFTRLTR